MKIIKCRLVPRNYCVNLFGTVWARDTSWIDAQVINHERIHTAQQRELLFVAFYIVYAVEWIGRLIGRRDRYEAYRGVSFEREAYGHAHDQGYLKRRRHYAMWRKKQ